MKTNRNQAHTSKSSQGSGDLYGSGIKNPIGKSIRSYIEPVKAANKIGKAPKSLA